MPVLVLEACFGPSSNHPEFGLVFIKSLDNGLDTDIGQSLMDGSFGHEENVKTLKKYLMTLTIQTVD